MTATTSRITRAGQWLSYRPDKTRVPLWPVRARAHRLTLQGA
jgi:hypothetical protein